ncbi:hypothetical protein [Streptomyces sp. NPDC046197]|uniref:hypothetical protein n=1 Tax=Streptomyces sp. NPDC046197 TaxID=3154337 RepID=UPI0033F71878
MDVHTLARHSLAAIRLVNGTAALLAPQLVAHRLGAYRTQPALAYVLRMFGVRTVVLGAELLVLEGEELRRALRVGTFIHATDALSAACAGREGTLPPRTARATTAVSTINAALTLLAQCHDGCPKAVRRRRPS